MTEEHKAKLKEGRERAKREKQSQFVSVDDFNSFKTSVVGILENISNKLNTPQEPDRRVVMATAPEKAKDIPKNTPSNEEVVHNLSPRHEQIFDKYFDREDGFKGMLNGVSFKIEVPLSLSNAQEAHLAYYGRDIRHKIMDGHDLDGSIEKYCKLVCQNLNYKRNVKLKI